MPKYLVLPKIGMNMEEGVIAEWLVKPGDRVAKDDIVVRAETDKAVQDIFATETGIVAKLLAQVGDTVPCQGKIAVVLEEGEEYSDEEEAEEPSTAPAETDGGQSVAPEKPATASMHTEGRAGKRISPLARKMAKELGIPPSRLEPEKPGKRIVRRDVLRAVEERENRGSAPEAEAGNGEGRFVPFTHIRKVIGRRMRESSNERPRVTLTCTVDCERLIAFREKLKKKHPVTYNEILAKACAQALAKNRELNVRTEEGGVRVMDKIHIGVAVDTEQGLLVPALRDVDRKGIFELAEEFAGLVEKARSGSLGPADMGNATFTVTNLGMYGVESFNPIINAPECFILGVGCMKKVPVVVDDAVCVRSVMQLALSFDHAVFDGGVAAKLLRDIKENLDDPAMMLS